MENVFVFGAEITPMKGRYFDKTFLGITQDLIAAFCERMGPWFNMSLVDFISYAMYNPSFQNHFIAESFANMVLGTNNIECDRVATGGQTGLAAMTRLYDAIRSGRHQIGLALGVEKCQDAYDPLSHSTTPMVIDTIAASWLYWLHDKLGFSAAGSYQFRINGYKYRYPRDLELRARALMVEEICSHSRNNPKAQRYGEQVTADWIMDSRPIIGDTRLGEVCVYSEGGAVIGMANHARAKEIASQTGRPLVRVAGVGHACESTIPGRGPQFQDISEFRSHRIAAERAYDMAGIGPDQVGVIGHHGAFGGQTLLSFLALKMCQPGHVQDIVYDGLVVGPNPKWVIDPASGLYGCGHAVGASNIMSANEVYWYMVENEVEWGLVHGTGGDGAVYGGVQIFHLEAA
ncbi:MAG: thiolase family protein [Patescibacteria group bacterium]